MDELGSALRHSDNANFKVSPFLFMPDGKVTSAVRYLYSLNKNIMLLNVFIHVWKLLF